MIPIQVLQLLTLAAAQQIHPELAAHTGHFARQVYKVTDNVYSAAGFALANVVMIEGVSGIIVVDTTSGIDSGRQVLAELRKITQKPVAAIIYTHFHPDHIGGAKAFATPDDVRAGKLEVIAHEDLLRSVVNQGSVIGPILGVRSGYSFGAGLQPEEIKGMNFGLGPVAASGPATFLPPTRTFREQLGLEIAGVPLRLVHLPSETDDHIAVYLPRSRTAITGDIIQGPAFPNIHTLRGTSYRDPVPWFKSIDRLRALGPEHMVPAHGRPVSGAARVEEIMRHYRDGIQFVHDQTVRLMNQGLTPDELADAVRLPAHLADFRPYLREYYGTVKHSVRQIYFGYLGWYAADPVALNPTPPRERARRTIALMGGRSRVLGEARKALESDDAQWAGELATHLIAANPEDRDARLVKAAAYRKLGFASMNSNWRNWYLVAARELDGTLADATVRYAAMRAFAAPDVIAALPACSWVEGHTTRLKADKTLDVHLTAAFRFLDVNESCALEIRRGVAQFHAIPPARTDLTFALTKAALDRALLGQETFAEVLKGEEGARLLSYFDQPLEAPIRLTVR
ncbi:MAG: MBL fold metallo-hydrolase [Acidobacteria bacterium]|nr:MBL fold metallo-hydrolase [Acidobacteriota bacterium]